MTRPSQNFIRMMSEVSQPMAFRIPISLFSSWLKPAALSQAKIKKASHAPAKMKTIMPPRQLKMLS